MVKGTFPKVWDGSEDPPGSPGWIGGPSWKIGTTRGPSWKIGTGRGTHPEVCNGSGDHWGGPGQVG